jgi:hypothetical protein
VCEQRLTACAVSRFPFASLGVSVGCESFTRDRAFGVRYPSSARRAYLRPAGDSSLVRAPHPTIGWVWRRLAAFSWPRRFQAGWYSPDIRRSSRAPAGAPNDSPRDLLQLERRSRSRREA